MNRVILNSDHFDSVLTSALVECRHRLFIATADLKHVHLPLARGRGRAESILDSFERLSGRGVEVRLLHSGVPSGPFLERMKEGLPETLTMRRCPRTHLKAVIVDGSWMYLGSANLTGAGLGAKSPRRRNFEAGFLTDDEAAMDAVADMLDEIWSGRRCEDCDRKEHCPVPLEEPRL